jgi:hypothetical protein
MNRHIAPWIAALSLFTGCTDDDFPTYNELEGLRVLGVRAEPADARPGAEVTIDALLYSAGDSIAQTWTLCPWPSSPDDGFRCLVNEASWKAAWKAAGLSGDPLPLELGDGDSATLRFPDDRSGLHALCNELLERVGAAGLAPPNCDEEWKWTLRLRVTSGDSEIETVKDVRLVLDDDPLNGNPLPTKLSVQTADGFAVLNEVTLAKDEEHELRVAISEDDAESYERRAVPGEDVPKAKREALTFTWFVEGGSTDRIRTIFGDDIETLRNATRNEWRTPKERKAARVFVVVRDDRGGIGWQTGSAVIDD